MLSWTHAHSPTRETPQIIQIIHFERIIPFIHSGIIPVRGRRIPPEWIMSLIPPHLLPLISNDGFCIHAYDTNMLYLSRNQCRLGRIMLGEGAHQGALGTCAIHATLWLENCPHNRHSLDVFLNRLTQFIHLAHRDWWGCRFHQSVKSIAQSLTSHAAGCFNTHVRYLYCSLMRRRLENRSVNAHKLLMRSQLTSPLVARSESSTTLATGQAWLKPKDGGPP